MLYKYGNLERDFWDIFIFILHGLVFLYFGGVFNKNNYFTTRLVSYLSSYVQRALVE